MRLTNIIDTAETRMDDETDMDLMNDKFADQEIDDAPLSYAASDFDEEECRSRPDTDFYQSPHSCQMKPTLTPICEEHTDDLHSVISSRSFSKKKEDFARLQNKNISSGRVKETDPHDSADFNNSEDLVNRMNAAENSFFGRGADVIFIEDDPRFNRSHHSRENSWEPSRPDYKLYHPQKTPPPVNEMRSPMVDAQWKTKEPLKVFAESQSVNKPPIENRQLESKTETKRPVPVQEAKEKEENDFRAAEPVESSPHCPSEYSMAMEYKTTEGGGRLRPKFADVSSIYAHSPNRMNPTSNVQDETIRSNVTVDCELIKDILEKKPENLMESLEFARKQHRDRPKPDFRFQTNVSRGALRVPATRQIAQETLRRPNEMPSQPGPRLPVEEVQTRWPTENSQFLKTREPSPPISHRQFEEERASSGSRQRADSLTGSERSAAPSRTSSVSVDTVLHRPSNAADTRSSSRISTASSTSSSSIAPMAVRPSRSKHPLTMSSRRLGFGYVAVGDSLSMDLDLTNVCERAVQVRATLDSNSKAFEVVDNRIMHLAPGQSSKVRILFKPMAAGRYQLMLEISTMNLGVNYQVPCWGCGGVADIQPEITPYLFATRTKDFVLKTSNFSSVTFSLRNNGMRDGFVRLNVISSDQNPIECKVSPRLGVVLPRKARKVFEVQFLDTNFGGNSRSSSSMSTSSSTTSRRSLDADAVIEIHWGEEIQRQRLKILEKEKRERILIDGLSFTDFDFEEEVPLRRTQDLPKILEDDRTIFEATCRVTRILVQSSRSSRKFAHDSMSGSDLDNTVVERTAYRDNTYFLDIDVTRVPY
ncbi:unnamed protein product [Caenorhabditis auriculariae]|uniref:Cep192/Spd-2-like domain-containing protein n=1 Tax=Caenorhabditis auriculariae TaxID=2777116 RepID=A0A8S1GSM4_9PELO|nr:unnamed protein product [Caenorhabditis auriculariae]